MTGHEAAEVRRVADGLKARLDHLDAIDGKEKDAGLKTYQVVSGYNKLLSLSVVEALCAQELNQADISLIHKTQLLERLTAIRKTFDKQRKDKENAANKAVGRFSLPRSL